jgi:hypothetical protein
VRVVVLLARELSANISASAGIFQRLKQSTAMWTTCRLFLPSSGPRRTPVPPSGFHGKEGVRGSSPREGFLECPARVPFF